jgi:hypothetical protein
VLRAFRTTEQTSDEALYMILDAYAIRLANIKTVYYCNNSNGNLCCPRHLRFSHAHDSIHEGKQMNPVRLQAKIVIHEEK